MTRSSDRQTIIVLRHRVQTLESTLRVVHARLDVFRVHLVAATNDIPIDTRTELIAKVAELRLLLAGSGEGQL
jgi:hypothetical protein